MWQALERLTKNQKFRFDMYKLKYNTLGIVP